MAGYVYIVTNHKRGTLYIGVPSNLERRIFEHRERLTPRFASRYGCNQLVWYEEHLQIGTAGDIVLAGLRRAQEQIGDEGDADLDAHGIL
ncbi:GIY-YIG nuclease family protein [Sinorhizobium meliloti]|uniref:GIY-YIG nuclease family protein n=1 Tax=Rhizobium meliloti TaxID=382 RepID=UPI0020910E91|nr:GIY-YIG nuclease family protein [Sinorhizobium meliloti]MCO5965852.1 GIY-YIG nuclease family protein [Sinorhizobium meliloti]